MPEHRKPSGRFRNVAGSPVGTARVADFWRFLRGRLRNDDSDIVIPEGHVLSDEEAAKGWEETEGDKLQWLGHSAFRWRVSGMVFLSDPLLTDQASPFSWVGPKRYIPSPLKPEDAKCDFVLLTHCHYDHLDLRTLVRLPNKECIRVVAPLGVGRILRKVSGFQEIIELDWHESVTIEDVAVTLVPAVHFSARTPWDRNRSLWGGYAIRSGEKRIYLSGDTAHHPTLFREIGERHGPFDYGLVPIGAYEPRCIMVEHHATPEEAVAIGRDVGAKVLLGHHWGALRLTTEEPFEPPGRFRRAAHEAGYADEDAWLMKVGETRGLG